MRYFLDTEFVEDGRTIDLISLGLVAEDGREFYAVSKEFDLSNCHRFLWENVLPKLPPMDDPVWMPRIHIAESVTSFCDPERYGKPEFWAYYADYDWVVFCWLFGAMIDLPDGFPMYCRDIKQLADSLGNPELPTQGKGEHDALADARWNKQAFEFLSRYELENY